MVTGFRSDFVLSINQRGEERMLYKIQAPALWIALLVASAALLSGALVCATPFAAFAALAAITLPRRAAVSAAACAWLADQLVGFAILHFPIGFESMTWSAILLAAMIATIFAVRNVCGALARFGTLASIVAGFLASQLVFRGLMIVAASILGGIEGFTIANLAFLSAVDFATVAGLLAISDVAVFVGWSILIPVRMAQPRA
jgi:hypothetical protein